MPSSKVLNNLMINKLTEAQYDAAVLNGDIGEDDLSLLTDVEDKAVQVDTMPTASVSEVGNIYQYVGTTDANYTNGYFYKCVSDEQNPATYSWAQISVQPGGGDAIEWATVVDLPDTYADTVLCAFTVPGGLPDGTYVFYYQTLCDTEWQNQLLAPVTYKIRIEIRDNGTYYTGKCSPVMNGDFMPDGNYVLPLGQTDFRMGVFKASNGDYIFWGSERPFFANPTPTYMQFTAVPGLWKLSKIKNIDTGDEYTATGAISQSEPVGDRIWGSVRYKLLQDVSIPQSRASLWGNDEYFFLSYIRVPYAGNAEPQQGALRLMAQTDNSSRYLAEMHFGMGSYTLRVIEATGTLANAQLGYDDGGVEHNLYFKPNANGANIQGVLSVYGTNENISAWGAQPTGNFVPLVVEEVGGTITLDNFGTVLQYKGATDANYTNGYFYKADGTIVNVPSSETITDPNSTGVIVSDPNNFIAERMIANNLSDGTYILEVWDHGEDESQNPLIGVSIFSLSDQWLMSIEPEEYPTMGGMTITGHTMDSTERLQIVVTLGGPAVTNPHWTRVDVQPTPDPLPSQTGQNGKFLTTNGTTASWGTVESLPSQTGQSGKFLTTDGTDASWSDKPLVNNATGTDSLTIEGNAASVQNAVNIGSQSRVSALAVAVGKYASAGQNSVRIGGASNSYSSDQGNNNVLIGYTAGSNWGVSYGVAIGSGVGVGANGAIQIGHNGSSGAPANTFNNDANTFKVANQNGNFEIMSADGTIPTERLTTLLEALYPVGSVYLGTQSTCPLATLLPNSTWALVASDKALWTGDGTNGNTTIAAALPNIKALLTVQDGAGASKKWAPGCTVTGAFTKENIARDAAVTGGATSYNDAFDLGINAHESNSIYDDNATTVQPPAYVVNVWRRTA